MIVKFNDKLKMDRDTSTTKTWKPIFLSNGFTPVQLQQEIKNRNLEKKLLVNSLKTRRFDMMEKSIRRIWILAGASDEAIDCRVKILKDDIEAEYKLSADKLVEKYKGLDIINFERHLVEEVVQKAGIDAEYENGMRIFEKRKELNPEYGKETKIRDKKVPGNVELKTPADITKFIRGRVDSFFSRQFSYPKDEKVETIGV